MADTTNSEIGQMTTVRTDPNFTPPKQTGMTIIRDEGASFTINPPVRFSAVLPALLKAATARRESWGPNRYIWLLPEANVPKEWCKEPHLLHLASTSITGKVRCHASIRMRMADDSVLTGWVPTAEDLFAEDWTIMEFGAAVGGTGVNL